MTTLTEEKVATTNMKKLKDKVAIVTGGTRGIGRAIAELYAKEGAQVIITGRSEANSAADELNSKLKEANPNDTELGNVVYRGCDISSKDAATELIKYVVDEYQQIDILVNNAGITKDNLFMRMKEDEWVDVINTDLNSLYYLCQPTVKAMSKKRSGSIINIGSVVGLHGNPAQTNYASAKAGMVGFTKALAKEYGRRNITVNCIAPGFITTDMTAEVAEETLNKFKEMVPLGDFGKTEDVAQCALFLATAANYITGQVIQVDGGLFM